MAFDTSGPESCSDSGLTQACGNAAKHSAEQLAVVRATLPIISQRLETISAKFYERLFTAHPELGRDLFNRGNQAQGRPAQALIASLVTYATALIEDDVESIRTYLRRIGAKHVSLGVVPDQYKIVHDNLLGAICEVLGDSVAQAWGSVYWRMAADLVQVETTMYADIGVAPGAVLRWARVVGRIDDPAGAATFTVISDEDSSLGTFRPGQYVSIAVQLAQGGRQLRQYSLHNRGNDKSWSFTVKRVLGDGVPEGAVSSHLLDRVRVGDRIQVTVPAGEFVVDARRSTPLLLISAGIGSTATLGLLSDLAGNPVSETTGPRQIRVLHADRSPQRHILREELLAAAHAVGANTTFYYESLGAGVCPGAEQIAGSPRPTFNVMGGRIPFATIDLPVDGDIYLYGPEAFLVPAVREFEARGVPTGRVHLEYFPPIV